MVITTQSTRIGFPRSIARTLVVVAGVGGLALGLSGCTGTTNNPGIDGSRLTFEDPNEFRTVAALIVATRFVGTRYVPGQVPQFETAAPEEVAESRVPYPMIVSAPAGLRRVYYERLCREVGSEVAPVTAEIAEAIASGTLPPDRPVFYIGRVWIREQSAQVDVYRPMPELGAGADGRVVYQMVTVRLTGGLQPWRAIHGRAWAPGAFPAPEPYVIPDVDRVDQYRITLQEREAAGLGEPTPPEIEQPSIEAMPEGLKPIEKF